MHDMPANPMRSLMFESLVFYFNINGLRPDDGLYEYDNAVSMALLKANGIHTRAHEHLREWLPKTSCWNKPESEFIEPYRLGDIREELQLDDQLLHAVWIDSEERISRDDMIIFRDVVLKAYEQSARELGGRVQLIGMETRTLETLVTSTPVELE